MRKIVFAIASFIVSITGLSQMQELSFSRSRYITRLNIFDSEQERIFLTNQVDSGSLNYLNFYMQILGRSVSDVPEKKINSFIAANGLKTRSYKSKELKKIYKEVHNTFLSRYVENPGFNEIFENGNYNCVTASALYAIILEKLAIPYSIRETPNHVYIIADPESADIIFETTAPGTELVQVTDKFKSQFVDYLVTNKLLSPEEIGRLGTDQLFEKYFYDDEKIDKLKLGGLMYYNLGIDAIAKENYELAYKCFEKAYLLYPCARTKYLVMVSLLNKLYQDDMETNENRWIYYLRYIELTDSKIANELLKEYVNRITQNLLFKTPQPGKFHAVYREILSNIQDSSLSRDLRYSYYYNTAHYFDIKNKYDSALLYIDSVYALNSGDLLVQELLTSFIIEQVQSIPPNDKVTIDTLDYFFKRYSFDKKGRLGEVYLYCLSAVTSSFFDKDNKKEGDKYFTLIKDMIAEQPAFIKKEEAYIAATFVQIYVYYVRHKQYIAAKEFLQSVEPLLPGNEDIALRMERIKDILENQ